MGAATAATRRLPSWVLGLIPLTLGVLTVQALGRWARRPALA